MAKKEEHEEHVNHERWLVSYADMVTLLMCVFIVLFAMATVDARKFAALKDSLNGKHAEHSVLEGSPSVIEGGVPQKLDTTADAPLPQFDTPSTPLTFDLTAAKKALEQQQQQQQAKQDEQNNLQQAKEEIQSALEEKGMGDQVRFTIDQRGLVVTVVTDKVLCDLGKADIRSEGQHVLDALAGPLAHLPNQISIEGHTDNRPISTPQFPTNWELSTSRATSVLRYLVDHGGVAPTRIGATGYGEMRPVVPNDTDAHRAQNRRVEIVVLSTVKDPGSNASDG